MTADGWRCPECGLILAPSVTEHRCDPPSAGVPAVKPDPDGGPDWTAQAVAEVRKGLYSIDETREWFTGNNVTVSVSAPKNTLNLSPAQVRELTAAIQQEMLRQARRNPRRRPGSAA